MITENLYAQIYCTIILPVVLYGCETWSLTLREECRLRVFKDRVLRGIFGPKKDDITGEWRRLHNEELYDLHSLPTIFRVIKLRRMRLAEHVARMGEQRCTQRFGGKPEGKRPFGRPWCRWEACIKMDLKEVECGGHGLDLSGSGEGQVTCTCERSNEPSRSIKCGEFLV